MASSITSLSENPSDQHAEENNDINKIDLNKLGLSDKTSENIGQSDRDYHECIPVDALRDNNKECEDDDNDEYHSTDEKEDDDERLRANDEQQRLIENSLSDDELNERRTQSKTLKEEGNSLFKSTDYEKAIKAYSSALQICPFVYAQDRAILFSNRAACNMRLEVYDEAIRDSTRALDHNPHYVKALLRRAELYEKTEKLDESLNDYKKVVEIDPSQHIARAACIRLPSEINERNEKMKAEMLGKLKDLGNMVLKPFGLSTNNFQMTQDPDSGGYSIKFNQNGQ